MIAIQKVRDSQIVFSNGWKIFHKHNKDCCEYNYADYKGCIEDSILEIKLFNSIKIEPAKHGFLLNGYLINCYSEQDGYYTRDLEIYLVDENNTVVQYLNIEGKLITIE